MTPFVMGSSSREAGATTLPPRATQVNNLMRIRQIFLDPRQLLLTVLHVLLTVRASEREQDRFTDVATREQHQQSVDTHPLTTRWRHPILKCAQEVLVNFHRLRVTGSGQQSLGFLRVSGETSVGKSV